MHKDEILDDMRAVKILLILQTQRQGLRRAQIAGMLGIGEAAMSRILPEDVSESNSKDSTQFTME